MNTDGKLIHGSNLKQKENHGTKYRDTESKQFLGEIRTRYDQWLADNLALVGPGVKPSENDRELLTKRVKLTEDYKDFIDQQKYAEKFDSRSNLHSSVLEEFMFFLFKDLVEELGTHALIGKSHSFKDIFFTPPTYAEMLERPYAKIEIKDHDFVIGATYKASFASTVPPSRESDPEEKIEAKVEKTPKDYKTTTVVQNPEELKLGLPAADPESETESHLFDIPAVAIECKTYLDKTMLEGSSRAADEIKARHPNGIYIVVMEYIKLTEAVNFKKYKVDQIYVLRKQKNVDREYRYLETFTKKPIDLETVIHLFNLVRTHLTTNWASGVSGGIERGWLIE